MKVINCKIDAKLNVKNILNVLKYLKNNYITYLFLLMNETYILYRFFHKFIVKNVYKKLNCVYKLKNK